MDQDPDDNMSADSQDRRYPYVTQDEEELTYDPPAGSQDRLYPCVTQYEEEFICDPPRVEIKVGFPTQSGRSMHIPRWVPGTKLLYFVRKDGFKAEDYEHVVSSFRDAAADWNDIRFGVTISRTRNEAAANFFVCYREEVGNNRSLARAFLPHRVKPVFVFNNTLNDRFWRSRLKGTFLHEIGHIIGLRHEFANDLDASGRRREAFAHQIGLNNYYSVMSYNYDKRINEEDRRGVLDFYGMKSWDTVYGCPITDYVAKPFL